MVLLSIINLSFNPGLCFLLLILAVPIGITASVMAGISLVKNASKWKKKVFALVAGLVPFVMLLMIPAFLRHLLRVKQEAAKSELTAVYELQKAYKAENGAYAASFKALGFKPENPYGYMIVMGDNSVGGEDWMKKDVPSKPETYARESKFKVMAVKNIDSDETVDVWTIDETGRLVNVVDDVVE